MGSILVADDSLTPEQFKLLRYIAFYADMHGCAPSLSDMCRQVRVKSTNSVRYYLRVLERKGYVARTPRLARGVKVLRMPGEG